MDLPFAGDARAVGSALREARYGRTHAGMNGQVARFLRLYAPDARRLVFLGGHQGALPVLRTTAPAASASAVIYEVVGIDPEGLDPGPLELAAVDPRTGRLPRGDETCDAVVCNQWLMRIVRTSHAISEAWRMLVPGGLFVVTVANLSALHNCLLLLAGRQPTTLELGSGHLRGFAAGSTGRYLTQEGRFRLLDVAGVGLHPFTSRVMRRPLRTYSHTTVWALGKTLAR